MASYVKGDAVENATSYELYEKVTTEAGGTQLLSETGATLYEEMSNTSSSSTIVDYTGYHTYADIPITAGHSYQIMYGRRLWTYDADGNAVRTLALHTSTTDYTFTAETGEVTCSISFKTSELAAAEATISDLTEGSITYSLLDTATEINFEVSALGLSAGDHTFVVKAKADGYADSAYSNEVTYTAT